MYLSVIDPGDKGAIAFGEVGSNHPLVIDEMPNTRNDLISQFEDDDAHPLKDDSVVVIEKINSFMGNLRARANHTKLYANYTACCYLALAFGHKLIEIQPKDWGKFIFFELEKEGMINMLYREFSKLPYSKRKDWFVKFAELKFPDDMPKLKKDKLVIADALCMWYYVNRNREEVLVWQK